MAQSRKACRDCGEPIGFIQDAQKTRWIPVDPGTENRHVCQIDQVCESCEKTFKGASWMKVCSECYRSGGKAPGEAPAPPSPSRTPEPLQDDMSFDDDKPPF